jgi:hypothetical protein
VERLLLAGLYHQSQLDRKNGRPDDAAALIEMAARRHPEDIEVQLLAAESLVLDRKAPEQALEALARIEIPRDNTRLRIRRGILEADAHEAAGDGVKARASIEALLTEFPDNARLKRRLEELD